MLELCDKDLNAAMIKNNSLITAFEIIEINRRIQQRNRNSQLRREDIKENQIKGGIMGKKKFSRWARHRMEGTE